MRRRRFLAVLPVALAGAPALARQSMTTLAPNGPAPIEVRDGGLVARFYAAPGVRKAPAVLMLGGATGGYPYGSAARDLAASGFSTLALAYFRDWQGKPEDLSRAQLSEVPLEYVFSALEWLKARPEADPDRIAVMGESRGAELALLVASHRPDVAGVVAYVPSGLRWGAVGGSGKAAWTLNGAALPFATGAWDPAHPMRQFTDVLDGPGVAYRDAEIDVERIGGPVLLISTTADRVWPSSRFADLIERRLKAKGFRHRVTNLKYDDASHLLMGFGPGATRFQAPGFTVEFGGTEEGTQRARNAGWAEAKRFLAALGC